LCRDIEYRDRRIGDLEKELRNLKEDFVIEKRDHGLAMVADLEDKIGVLQAEIARLRANVHESARYCYDPDSLL